jgi:hypothetical protein
MTNFVFCLNSKKDKWRIVHPTQHLVDSSQYSTTKFGDKTFFFMYSLKKRPILSTSVLIVTLYITISLLALPFHFWRKCACFSYDNILISYLLHCFSALCCIYVFNYKNMHNTAGLYITSTLYRSCIALFYRKRLPQQQGDRRIRERDTSMH